MGREEGGVRAWKGSLVSSEASDESDKVLYSQQPILSAPMQSVILRAASIAGLEQL